MKQSYCFILVGLLERVKAEAKRHGLTMQGKRGQVSLPMQQNPSALRSVLATAFSDGVAISVQNGDPNRRCALTNEEVSRLIGASPERIVHLATTRYEVASEQRRRLMRPRKSCAGAIKSKGLQREAPPNSANCGSNQQSWPAGRNRLG